MTGAVAAAAGVAGSQVIATLSSDSSAGAYAYVASLNFYVYTQRQQAKYTHGLSEAEGNPNLVNGPLSLLETAVRVTDRLFDNDYLWKLNVTHVKLAIGFQVSNESIRSVSLLVRLT